MNRIGEWLKDAYQVHEYRHILLMAASLLHGGPRKDVDTAKLMIDTKAQFQRARLRLPESERQNSWVHEAEYALQALLDLAWRHAFGASWQYQSKTIYGDREVISTFLQVVARTRAEGTPRELIDLLTCCQTIHPPLRGEEKEKPARAPCEDPMPHPYAELSSPPERRPLGAGWIALIAVASLCAALLVERYGILEQRHNEATAAVKALHGAAYGNPTESR